MKRFINLMLFTVYPLAFYLLYAALYGVIEDYVNSTFRVAPLALFGILVPILYGFTIGIIEKCKQTDGKTLWQLIYLLAAIAIILFSASYETLHRYMDVWAGFPILTITIGIYLYDLIYTLINRRKNRQ